jgi:hypothetical protein
MHCTTDPLPPSWNKRKGYRTMTDENTTAGDERHSMKMAKKKAARDKIMATKTDKKGLIIVHTGKGKGVSRMT